MLQHPIDYVTTFYALTEHVSCLFCTDVPIKTVFASQKYLETTHFIDWEVEELLFFFDDTKNYFSSFLSLFSLTPIVIIIFKLLIHSLSTT